MSAPEKVHVGRNGPRVGPPGSSFPWKGRPLVALRELPNGRWQAVVSVRVGGRVRRITRMAPPGAGRRQAKQLEDQIRAELSSGRRTATAAKASTLVELVTRFLEIHAPNVRPSSIEAYRHRLEDWIAPHPIGKIRVDRLTVADLERHYAGLIETGLSPSSVHLVHVLIHSALDLAVRWETIPRNVAALARKPRQTRRETIPPTQLLAESIAAHAWTISPEWGLWVHLSLVTGARRGEISGLRWGDLDLDRGELQISRTMHPGGSTGPTKAGGRRVVLDAATVALLTAHRDELAELVELLRQDIRDRWIFTSDPEAHRPRSYTWPAGIWSEARKEIPGAGSVRLHDLRHFAASSLLARGISVVAAAHRLGNSPEVLLSTYGHTTELEARRAGETSTLPRFTN